MIRTPEAAAMIERHAAKAEPMVLAKSNYLDAVCERALEAACNDGERVYSGQGAASGLTRTGQEVEDRAYDEGAVLWDRCAVELDAIMAEMSCSRADAVVEIYERRLVDDDEADVFQVMGEV